MPHVSKCCGHKQPGSGCRRAWIAASGVQIVLLSFRDAVSRLLLRAGCGRVGMGVLSKLLCSTARNGSGWGLQAAAPFALNASRAYASAGGDYTIIDHEYDAVVVGAGGALLLWLHCSCCC